MTDNLMKVREALNKAVHYIRPSSDRGRYEQDRALCEEALALLDKNIQDGGWRPIETAPRDGSYILLGHENYTYPEIGKFNKEYGLWITFEKDVVFGNRGPTHWQPIQPPPKGKAHDPA